MGTRDDIPVKVDAADHVAPLSLRERGWEGEGAVHGRLWVFIHAQGWPFGQKYDSEIAKMG